MKIPQRGRFNPLVIVADHLATLRIGTSGKLASGTVFVLLLVPAVVAGGLLAIGQLLSESRVGILITSLSIFAALLFNLLMLVYDIVRKAGGRRVSLRGQEAAKEGAREAHDAKAPAGLAPESDKDFERLRQSFLREIFANLSFAVLVSLVVVIFLMLWLLIEGWFHPWLVNCFAFLSYYGITLFLLTFFMVLRRVHILLREEFGTLDRG